MQEQQIAEIKQAMVQLMAFIQERQGELTEQEQTAIAQALDHAASRISQLRQEQQMQQEPEAQAPAEEPEADKLRMARTYPSSNVHSFAYDPEKQQLFVRFQGDYPKQDGPVYSYGGVPEDIFNMFQRGAIPARTKGKNKWGEWFVGKNPSLGASLNALIKTAGYPYQRVA